MLWYWNKFSLLTLSVFIFITSFFLSPAYGELIHTFEDPTPTSGDQFGFPVSVSGNLVLVGATGDDTNGLNVGQAHLFDAITGERLLTFDDPTVTVSCGFGRSVSIDGVNALLTGCGGVSGQAYLFNVSTCDADTSNGGTAGDKVCEAPTQTYDNPGADPLGWGSSASIDGNTVVVGNEGASINGKNVGKAYLFDAASGELLLTLEGPLLFRNSERFGASVSMDGNNVVVGAYQSHLDDGFNFGKAYLYNITTCDADTSNGGTAGDKVCEAALHTFDDPTPTMRDWFGFSASISGTKVLVGEPNHRTGASFQNQRGQAHLFDAASGERLLTFDDPTPTQNDNFGISVSIDGNNVVVGASGDDTTFANSGEAHLYNITTCDADTSNGGTAGDKVCEAALKTFPGQSPGNTPCPGLFCVLPLFGLSVSIDGSNVVVGEPFLAFVSIITPSTGRAYLFEINGDTDGDGVPDNMDQCPGFDDALDHDNDGIPDGCDPNTIITANTDAVDTTFGGHLTVDGASFTIPSGITVNFDFVNNKIIIKNPGGKILIVFDGKIT